MQTTTGRGSGRACRAAAVAVLLAVPSCQTYRPQPLDLAAHRQAWVERQPDSAPIRELFLRLAESQPAGAAFDAADGVSLPEAEAVALVYNSDVRIARLRAEDAANVASKTGRWEDPEFGFESEKILRSVSHPWIAGAALGITLPFSGRLAAQKRHACAEERAAVARVVADEWALRTKLRTHWLQWSYQTLRAELSRASLERVDRIAAVAARLEQSGELSRIEGRLFRAERASRVVEMKAVDARAEELALEIKALMGLVPEAPVTLQPAFSPAGPRSPRSVEENPYLSAQRAQYDVAEEALRVEIRKQYPDLTISPGYKVEDGDPRLLLGLDLTLPVWNRNVKGIAQARGRRELARAEFETAYEALVARLAAAELQMRTATAQRTELESALVPLLEEQSGDVDRVVALGQVNTVVMLDTLLRQHEAKLKLLDARLQETLAAVRVQDLAGPMSKVSEGSP